MGVHSRSLRRGAAPPCAPRVFLAAPRAVGGGPREPSSGPYVTGSEFPDPGTRELRLLLGRSGWPSGGRPDARTRVQAGTSSATGLLGRLRARLLLCGLRVSCLTYFPFWPWVSPRVVLIFNPTFLQAPPLSGRTGPLQPGRLEAGTCSDGPQVESARKARGRTLTVGLSSCSRDLPCIPLGGLKSAC